MYITDNFDSGNIRVISLDNPDAIQLEIKLDNQSDFYQWFHFRFEGEVGRRYRFQILNAGKAAFPDGWPDYRTCYSYDRDSWPRTETRFDGQLLEFELTLEQPSVYFAYFAPYPYERHQNLLHWAQQDARVGLETLGQTLDGRDMTMLTVGDSDTAKRRVWVIARQHPGETMAAWFAEGFLTALLDPANPTARALLAETCFYVVPNMNPDGAVRGNLRTNAAGANLNREWQEPSMERSPEVYLVRERMLKVGGDLFLDIHGDEALPYNFVAGCEGNTSYDERHAALEETFKQSYIACSPDFQDTFGYDKDEPGTANMTVAANRMGDQFRTLSYTIEMPFKDNADLADEDEGWSPARSQQLGADVLQPIRATLATL